VSGEITGPRLAIADLNENNTYNFGTVPIDEPASHDFTAENVGDEPLRISRIYSACGCTAMSVGDYIIDPSGFIVEGPMVLQPGEAFEFRVEFDPRAEGVRGSQAKYVQIFSNDPTWAVFDQTDPDSHETRFRIVVDPE
jgi:hypothetical protein